MSSQRSALGALPGSQEPQVSNYPEYWQSAGREAVILAANAGLDLDPWQRRVLQHSLGEREDHRWSAFEVGLIVSRQNGKGSILEARELFGMLLGEEKLIMHTAHELKTAMEHFRRMIALFESSDDLRKRVKKISHANGDEGIELRNGSRLRFVARSKGSGRGFSGDLVILDEAYALTPEQVGALTPTLSARPNPQIWYTSSPPLDAVTGSHLFATRRRGVKPDPRERGRLAWFDWGIQGHSLDDLRSIDLDDRRLWAAANPALGIRISEEFIEAERHLMDDVSFARERLGVWPPDLGEGGWLVIHEDDWQEAFDAASFIDGPLAFAAAVSLDRSRTSIAAAGRRSDGGVHIEVTSKRTRDGDILDNRPGTGWVVPRLRELVDKHEPCAVVMDEFGPTGSLIASAEADGLKIERIGTSAVARAFGMIYDGIAGDDRSARNIRHIGQPELTAAVAGALKRPLGEGFSWDRRAATVDITPLVACTNALWGLLTRGHIEPVEPWVIYD